MSRDLDITGDVCPLTHVKVQQVMARLPADETLRVTLRPVALKNVMTSLKTNGHAVVRVERGEDRIVLEIAKAGSPAAAGSSERP